MKIRLADTNILNDSIVDGEGIRAVIWTQGCSHNCPSCHNKETHDFNGGNEVDITLIEKQLDEIKIQDGITLSGGDPFFQPIPCTEIAKYAKHLGFNVWAYSGFTYEELINNPNTRSLLENIDVLVDGKFMIDKKSYDCKFRGSTNQRIIDVPKSLKENRVCIIKKYDTKKKKTIVNNCLFI